MHDLHFSDSLEISILQPMQEVPFANEACVESEGIFRKNFTRAISLVSIPGMAFVSGEGWMAAREVFNARHPDIVVGSDEHLRKVKELFDFTMANIENKEFNANFKMGTANAASILCQQTIQHGAFHSLLQGVVILAWTAFEVLAEDLHTLCLEKHPDRFPRAVLTGKKYQFRRLDDLPKSYHRAFNDTAIVAEVENPDVRALGLLRHLLVHKGGKVDQKHLDQRVLPPVVNQLNSFGLNSTVELTGTMASSLLNPVTIHAYRLLRLVDTWLAVRKPK